MPRIAWVEDGDASGEVAGLFDAMRASRQDGRVPAILRTMSHRPDLMAAIDGVSRSLHFTDGALTRAQHELIASYVAALNRCRY
jgi:hypothetical protein